MRIIILFLTISIINSQTEYPGLNIFFSSDCLSLGGAGYLNSSSISQKHNPATFNNSRIFTSSIINYKNNVSCQSIGLSFPLKNGNVSSSLKNVSYGVFQSYDEKKNFIGTYQSSDNWFSLLYANRLKNSPIKFGVSYNYLYSSLGSFHIKKSFFSGGGQVSLKKIKTVFGFSIHHIGLNNNSYNKNLISPKLVFSILKILEHLPLNIFVDLIFNSNNKNDIEIFIGGKFNLVDNFKLNIGTSTRKFDQKVNNQIFNSVFGASGIGLVYEDNQYLINVGSYMYGTGFLIHGVQLDLKF